MAYWKGILSSIEQGILKDDGFQPISVEEKIHDAIQFMVREKLELL